jgi:hypothetical protein
MKNRILLASLALASLVSCVGPGAMDPRAFDPALPTVLDQFDAYVATGVGPDGVPLDLVDQETWAAMSAEIRATWQTALDVAEAE